MYTNGRLPFRVRIGGLVVFNSVTQGMACRNLCL